MNVDTGMQVPDWAWFLLIAIIWLVAIIFFVIGLGIKKETHKDKTFLHYDTPFHVGGTGIWESIFAFIMGWIIKIMPWWMARMLFYSIGFLFFAFGIWLLIIR